MKLYTISTLIEQIIKSKIYTCITQKANIQGNIAIIEDCVKNLKMMKLSNLKMEYITRLNSDSMLYKQAGNSIVVNVLEQIFKNLLTNYKKRTEENTMCNLILGDCIKHLKTIPDNSIDLIITDPPYRTTPRGSSGTMGGYWKEPIAKKGNIFNYNSIEFSEYIPEFYRVLKESTILYIMCNNSNLQNLLNVGTQSGFNFVKCLIWEKGNKICGRYYMGCYEYILLFRKGKDRPINNCSTPDILKVPINKLKDENGKNLHNTEKPVELMKILIENSSNVGDIILDPFMGIGATGIAAKELNRKFIGIELDEKYYNIAKNRIYNSFN